MASKNKAEKVQKSDTDGSSNTTSGNETSSGNNSAARRKTTSGTVVKSRYLQTEKESSVGNSASGNDSSSGNNSGARRKTTSSATVVKSRYLQTEKKSTVTKNNTPKTSVFVLPRPASPKTSGASKPRTGSLPRHALSRHPLQPDQNSLLTPSVLETSCIGGNILHSTVLDGHSFCPDFDPSVIKEITALPTEAGPKAQKRNLELDTFLLAFITAKIEHNTHKLKEEAERNLLIMMQEDEKLRSEIASKKLQYLRLEKQKQFKDSLDLQISALTPAPATAKQFTEEYKVFTSAIDTTRHELPVKNLHIEDSGKFLGKALERLNESEHVLQQYVRTVSTGSENAAECLKEIKHAAKEMEQQLLSTSSNLSELSSLVSREAVLVQQSLEEDNIGLPVAQTLFSK